MTDQNNIDQETGEVLPAPEVIDTLAKWPKYIVGLSPSEEMQNRGKLALKLSKAYKAIEAVLHDDTNTEHKYSFASAETIYRTVRQGLHEVGLAVLPIMGDYYEIPLLKKDNSGDRRGAYLLLEFDFCLIDSETGYTVVIPWRGEVMEYGDKAFNKASTNATKYMLRTLFLLPTDKDEDSDKDSPQDRPQTKAHSSRGDYRPTTNRNDDQDRTPKTPKAPVEVSYKEKIRLANAMIREKCLDQDPLGLKSYSTLAKSNKVDPLEWFYNISQKDKGLDTWDKYKEALQKILPDVESSAPNSNPGESPKLSEGEVSPEKNESPKTLEGGATEKQESQGLQSSEVSLDSIPPQESAAAITSYGTPSQNSGDTDPNLVDKIEGWIEKITKSETKQTKDLVYRVAQAGLKLAQVVELAFIGNDNPSSADMVSALDELEARGR